jgi:SUN family beta-glucosidase
MRAFTEITVLAVLLGGAAADSVQHQHQHLHRHVKKHNHSPVALAERDVVWTTDVQTVYVDEDGETVDSGKAFDGIKDGSYIIVGATTPSFTPPPPPKPSTTTEAGQFFEHKPSAAPSSSPSSSSSPPPPSSPSAPPPPPTPSAPSTPGGQGVSSSFPSGTIPCSNGPPTDYGAILLPNAGLGGWASLQKPSNGFTPGVLIQSISTPPSCGPNTFCSYGCGPGLQKSQWPVTSQGATGQSVGGLWCNAQGFLELTRPDVPQLCIPGAGGVTVQNNLGGSACMCRTDYPASESMVIPVCTNPGGSNPVTNPSSQNYYQWLDNGVLKPTTAQYYLNPMNVDVNNACTWTSASHPNSAGNWAAMNIGVGQDASGITYISLFANVPTSNAQLDYNVQITGTGISGSCSYTAGQGYSGGSGNGCTVSQGPYLHRHNVVEPRTNTSQVGMAQGGSATIVLSH